MNRSYIIHQLGAQTHWNAVMLKKGGRQVTTKFCDTIKYVDPKLSGWENYDGKSLLPTQVKFAAHTIMITRDEQRNIQIDGEIHQCPPYTFMLDVRYP